MGLRGKPYFSFPNCLSSVTSSPPTLSFTRQTPLLVNSSSHSGSRPASAVAESCSYASSSDSLAERAASAASVEGVRTDPSLGKWMDEQGRTLTASQSDTATAERPDGLDTRPSRRRLDRSRDDRGSNDGGSGEGECLFCETGGHFGGVGAIMRGKVEVKGTTEI